VKYVVLVPDGAGDYPQDSLGGRTPLQAARTPNMDRLAREGAGGLVTIIPPGRPPGSDVGNLEIFGYDSCAYATGRAPLEAASQGIVLADDEVAFRCNLITRDGDVLVDYSAGHLSREEGEALLQRVATGLSREGVRFYPGVGYRHLVVWRGGPDALVAYPPHDIMGQSIAAHLPTGPGQEAMRSLMDAAGPILAEAPENHRRMAAGQPPANAIWLWGAGRALRLPTLRQRYGLVGGVISAVDLVRGIGRIAGLQVIEVPGITGYLDTNYAGKAEYALRALERLDLVYLHVEAPDEAAHAGDAAAKVQALEEFDAKVVGPVCEGLPAFGRYRVLLVPDHRTPIQLRTHSREPVPFALWGTGVQRDDLTAFDEESAVAGSLHLERGHLLMEKLVSP
jgi:2,3-bisphosphoglycerate-independent phosphoglycerate mutase